MKYLLSIVCALCVLLRSHGEDLPASVFNLVLLQPEVSEHCVIKGCVKDIRSTWANPLDVDPSQTKLVVDTKDGLRTFSYPFNSVKYINADQKEVGWANARPGVYVEVTLSTKDNKVISVYAETKETDAPIITTTSQPIPIRSVPVFYGNCSGGR